MKEPFTLYSSGIALARFAAEHADITHSGRDILGLDFSEPRPMTAQNDTDYAAVKLQPYRLLTLRTEFEAAAASAPAEFSVDGLRYTRAERNGLLYYIQRGVKFPCDALFRDGRLIGRDHFYLNHVEGESKSAILGSFIKQFYAGTPYIPRELSLIHI